MIEGLILVLALAGLAVSLYFTFAYYGRIRKARWVPEILCAREGSSCVTVVETPYARVFAVPNSLLGVFYYLAVIGWALIPGEFFVDVFGRIIPLAQATFWVLLPVSVTTVGLGFHLIHALRRILRIDCPLCYAAHAINATLLVLLILRTYWML